MTSPIALHDASPGSTPHPHRWGGRIALLLCAGLLAACEQPGEAWSPRLNDTGITDCADGYGNDLPCADPAAGTDAFPGQDAEQGRDADQTLDADGRAGFRFTKLDVRGQPLPLQDRTWEESGSEAEGTRWSCVRDEVTGLVWEVKVDDPESLHHRGHFFSWYDPDPATNGGSPGTPGGGGCEGVLPETGGYTGCDTHSLARYVNEENGGLCGYTDWRLPQREVLRSIVDYSVQESAGLVVRPNLDRAYFPNARPYPHWSASPYAAAEDADWAHAWGLDFDTGKSVRLITAPLPEASASSGGQFSGASSTVIGAPPLPDPDFDVAGARLVRGGVGR